MIKAIDMVKYFKIIIFDFDGVIKESVQIKTNAFRELFSDYGPDIMNKVQTHHEKHGGISRYEKISFYFENFLGNKLTNEELEIWCENYRDIILKQVLQSDWVPGVLEFLKLNYKRKDFFIATGTPQKEIDDILEKLKIKLYFKGVFGSPTKKETILNYILKEQKCKISECIMIGDSMTDYLAAKYNNITFVLRETIENKLQFTQINCLRIRDFSLL